MADLVPQSPFATFAPAAAGQGLVVTDRDGLGIATILVRKGQDAALAARVRETFGIDLPRNPRRAVSGGIAFCATGPETWLAVSERGGDAFVSTFKHTLRGVAGVVNQSDGYAVLRIAGPCVRETLAKGIPLDLDPRAFKVGDVATTVVSHIGLTLWRLDDRNGTAVFELMVARSLAASFWHWLSDSSAEFGMTIEATR